MGFGMLILCILQQMQKATVIFWKHYNLLFLQWRDLASTFVFLDKKVRTNSVALSKKHFAKN
jgi:hypothetical protein